MQPQQPIDVLPPKKTKESYQKKTKKKTVKHVLTDSFIIIVSSFLISFSSHTIIAPNHFVSGGVTGIAIILEHILNIPQSASMFVFNIPLVVISFFFVKKKFAVLSGINILMQSGWLLLLEQTNIPLFVLDEGEQIYAVIAGGIGIGIAVALAFKIGGSTGGTDIVAVLLQKRIQGSSIAWIIFFINTAIISSSYFVYQSNYANAVLAFLPVIKATCEQYIESKMNDTITNGIYSAIEFRVITDKPEELSLALISRLGRGVTAIPTTGMYTKEPHSMLLCVINRRQVASFKRILTKVDPDSFAVMSGVSQVLGLGFFSGE